jgi:hypothetical protein
VPCQSPPHQRQHKADAMQYQQGGLLLLRQQDIVAGRCRCRRSASRGENAVGSAPACLLYKR